MTTDFPRYRTIISSEYIAPFCFVRDTSLFYEALISAVVAQASVYDSLLILTIPLLIPYWLSARWTCLVLTGGNAILDRNNHRCV